MDALSEFLEKEAEKLRTCWTAFLSPFKNLKLPLPARYAEEFARAEKLPPEEKRHVLAQLLEDSREILSWLLAQRDIREAIAIKGRLNDLEDVLARLQELEEQVHYLRKELLRDELTKLWNRRALNIFFPQIIERITEGKELYILAFLDLCDLKRVNDAYGHDVGDRVIIQAAQRLKAHTKRMDVPIRIGGDEFVLLLAAHSLEKTKPFFKDLISEPVRLMHQGKCLEIFMACGATDILGADTLESSLRRADMAMYKHKTLLKEWIDGGREGEIPHPVLLRAMSKNS